MRQSLVVAGFLLAGCAACSRPAPRASDAVLAVPVIAEPVRLGTIRGTVSATGVVTTLPAATFDVTAHQPARVAEITKKAGDAVKSGEVLVRFEFPSLRPHVAVNAAAVKAAEVRLNHARLAQSRVSSLLSRGAASRREMEDADREVTLAEAELGVASDAMRATESLGQSADVRAPFSGTVIARLHNPGDLVRAGSDDPILRLIDPTQVQVTATVAVANLNRFTVGAAARAVAAIDRAQPAQETLIVASRPEPSSGASTVAVTLAFDSATSLAPGTQVGVEIDAEQRSNVPLVRAIAVLQPAGEPPFVMVAAGNVAQRRPVVVGLTESEDVEIRSGLKAGELVITQGHSSLRDGAAISVSPP